MSNYQSGRIGIFVALAIAAFFVAIPTSMWLARPPSNVTQAERLGAEIGCTCGTCPLRPIATCGCGFADTMLVRLDTEVTAGRTDDEIMAIFVADYGNSIRIKPKGTGFDLMVWAAPMVLLMVGAVAMGAVISNWRSQSDLGLEKTPLDEQRARDPEPSPSLSSTDPTRYLEIVEGELDSFED
jgi:cytochrome c-type biogenesis protein CcmH